MKRYTLQKAPPKIDDFHEADALNEEQHQVVYAQDGPILVIAGAGSGKTRTLTYRVARLVHAGVPANRILLCTFTNKAAREMVARVERLLRRSTDELWAGTFHHIANRILRKHAPKIGYESNFTILDREDSAQLIDEAIRSSGVLEGSMRFPKGRALTSLFGLCRSTERNLEAIILERFPKFEAIVAEINDVWQHYQKRKKQLNLMDFDDLLLYWRDLLMEYPDVQKHYNEYFLHVLVDEYQDTNPLQASIIDLMASARKNITVVGDDAQSIYSFRGADCRHILEFPERYENSQTYYLNKNYRSRPEILHTSNRVIAYNQFQFPKELISTRPAGMKPALVITKNARQEADFIAQRVRELQEEGIPLSEIAVLYRIHSHSLELQLALQHHNIPFLVRSGVRFFEQAHIKDMVAFLRIVDNTRDELSWRRLLPMFPGIGQATIEKVWSHLESNDFALASLEEKDSLKTLTKNARRSLQWLLRLLEEAHQLHEDPSAVLRLFYEQEYQDHLEHAYDNAHKRSEDIEQLATFAREYASTRHFLDEMTLLSEVILSPEDGGTDTKEDQEALVLSTVHQAKGLEWKAVFVLDMRENSFPFFLSIEEENLEEERRLFYVATTRAKDELYLIFRSTYAHRKWGWRNSKPSRFLWEVLTPPEHEDEPPDNTLPNLLEASNEHPLLETWIVDEDALINIDDF